jgi:hypothetical protein
MKTASSICDKDICLSVYFEILKKYVDMKVTEKYNEVVPVLLQGISFSGDFPFFKEKVGILDHHALHVYISPPELESAD